MNRQGEGLGGDSPGRKELKKRVFVSTDGDRPQKTARMGVSDNTHCLEDISSSRRRRDKGKVFLVGRLVPARKVKDNVVLLLMR